MKKEEGTYSLLTCMYKKKMEIQKSLPSSINTIDTPSPWIPCDHTLSALIPLPFFVNFFLYFDDKAHDHELRVGISYSHCNNQLECNTYEGS